MKISHVPTNLELSLISSQAFFLNTETQNLSIGPDCSIDDTIPYQRRSVMGATLLMLAEGSEVRIRHENSDDRYGVIGSKNKI